MSDLKARLLKGSTIKSTAVLSKSEMFNKKDVVRTRIPALNIALSGEIDGGMSSGLTVLAGPSKHFKSNMGLTMVAAYMRKYQDAVCMFYDSEGGCTPAYLKSMGVDPDRVIHTPILDVGQLKIDMAKQLELINRGDKVIFFVDSIGNLASRKELEDALSEKSTQDMSRARDIKSLFRIVTPYFQHKDIPGVIIAHTYQTLELYSKTVVAGGGGVTFASDSVFTIGRRQIKEGTEIVGYEFVLTADKSRFIKERSQIPITVTFDGGISPFSGLIDIAMGLGFVVKPSNGWYSRAMVAADTGEMVTEERKFRLAQTNSVEFWGDLLKHEPFREAIKTRYKLGEVVNDAAVTDAVEDLIGSEATMGSPSIDLDSYEHDDVPEEDYDDAE